MKVTICFGIVLLAAVCINAQRSAAVSAEDGGSSVGNGRRQGIGNFFLQRAVRGVSRTARFFFGLNEDQVAQLIADLQLVVQNAVNPPTTTANPDTTTTTTLNPDTTTTTTVNPDTTTTAANP